MAVAIEVDELPAGDLPGAIRGDGDQGVAAGVIADFSWSGDSCSAGLWPFSRLAGVESNVIEPRIRR